MAITAAMVKELREMTGAGMMDCKKALTETNGDMEAAVDVLKKSGAAKMEKKASRIAAEGIARVAANENSAVVVEVNSETDFVAKNETFQEFVQVVADNALASGLEGGANGEDIEAVLEMNGLKDLLVEKTATIGEKLSVRRFAKVTGDCVASIPSMAVTNILSMPLPSYTTNRSATFLPLWQNNIKKLLSALKELCKMQLTTLGLTRISKI